MSQAPAVLLLDDGELDDIKDMLEEAQVAYGRVRGEAIAQNTPPPSRLLVATPRRIDAVRLPEPDGSEEDGLIRIVVVSEDSNTLRARLREVGFDYLVRRPVHPEALRLLLLHCVYTGEERRTEPRVPVGFEVSFRTGLLPRRATLADLSTRGGRVVRMTLDEHLRPELPYSAAVAFDPVSPEVRHELEWILEERARGPATLREEGEAGERHREGSPDPDEAALDPPETRGEDLTHGIDVEVDVRMEPGGVPTDLVWQPEPGPEEPPAPELAAGSDDALEAPRPEPPSETPEQGEASRMAIGKVSDRRRGRRGQYMRRVPAFGERAMRVLVARDLSMGGMRVASDSGLQVGDRLHLAIYGDANEEPFLVWATVERDDGPDGLGLAFDSVHPVIAQQLEKVVADLPAVESLHHDEVRAMGTVVTEILDA
jgi:hypothetical protein